MYGHHATAGVLCVLALGCGSPTPGTRPDDMSAAEHEHAAGEHQAMSEQHEGRYDPSATDTREGRSGGARGGGPAWPVRIYNPTEGHHAEAERHAEHAAEHAAAGEALRRFEQAQCQGFPPETRASCPLMGTVASVEDIDGGVRLHVTAGVPSEAVLGKLPSISVVTFPSTTGGNPLALLVI